MIAHAYLDLLGELGITASHSRPRVSNDNPHSESQFKTINTNPVILVDLETLRMHEPGVKNMFLGTTRSIITGL